MKSRSYRFYLLNKRKRVAISSLFRLLVPTVLTPVYAKIFADVTKENDRFTLISFCASARAYTPIEHELTAYLTV